MTDSRSSTEKALQVSGERLAVIDGIRGPLVIAVLAVHFNVFYLPPESIAEHTYAFIVRFGMMSMEVFFVVSGYLITGILLRSKGTERYFTNFYVRRALRILPLYYGFIALWFFVVPRMGVDDVYAVIGGWRSQLFYWFHSANILWAIQDSAPGSINHFWSLSVEEQFYLIWPVVVARTSTSQLVRVCFGLVAIAPLSRVLLVAGGFSGAAYTLPLGRMDSIALGALLAVAATRPGGIERHVRWAKPLAWAAIAFTLVLFASLQRDGLRTIGPRSDLFVTVGLSISALLAVSIVVLALSGRLGRVSNFLLTRPPLTVLGRYCYGMYIIHKPLVPVAERFGFTQPALERMLGSPIGAQLVYTLLMTCLSFVVAWIVWHAWEKQFLKLKGRFTYGTARDVPTPTGQVGVVGVPAPARK